MNNIDSAEAPYDQQDPDYPFNILSREAQDLYLDVIISRLETPPTALEFYRDYVARNRPCIICGACEEWPALTTRSWTNQYLKQKAGDVEVTIDTTPDGYGDVIRGSHFVTPHESRMTLSAFLDILIGVTPHPGVSYAQHQNSSLTQELLPLVEDVQELEFAKEAFNATPDAINFWMGNDRAISSLHHDPYENLYVVIAGLKHFTLLPPTDLYWLSQHVFPKAHYELNPDGTFSIIPDIPSVSVPWIPLDPDDQQDDHDVDDENEEEEMEPRDEIEMKIKMMRMREKQRNKPHQNEDKKIQVVSSSIVTTTSSSTSASSIDTDTSTSTTPSSIPWSPELTSTSSFNQQQIHEMRRKMRCTSPLRVTLCPGEVLYLPSLWYHRVSQSADNEGRAIAVNYWYDMAYDSRYNYYRFMEHVVRKQLQSQSQSQSQSA